MDTVVKVGQTLPEFELVDATGRTVTLEWGVDGRPMVIHLMRSSSCPVCLTHAAALQRLLDDGSLGDAGIMLIAPGGADEARDASSRAARRAASATVLASETAHAALGLGEVALLQQSATIVIDRAGTIRSLRASTLPTGSFASAEVRAAMTKIGLAE